MSTNLDFGKNVYISKRNNLQFEYMHAHVYMYVCVCLRATGNVIDLRSFT